jgi:hypothetical protein
MWFPVLLFCLSLVAAGQPESGALRPDAEVEGRLRSTLAWEQAWGAYLAGEWGRHEHVPQLLALLPRPAGEDPQLSAGVRVAVLDALIRLDVDLRPEQWFPHLGTDASGELFGPTLVLLARDLERNRGTLVALLHRSDLDPRSWRLAARVLAHGAPADAGRRLYEEVVFRVRFEVHDPGPAPRRGASSSVGCGLRPGPFGFPPASEYHFAEQASAGHTPLAGSPLPVFFRREPPGRWHCDFSREEPVDSLDRRSVQAHDLLAEWLAMQSEATTPRRHSTIPLPWLGRVALEASVALELEALRTAADAWTAALVAADLLTAADAAARPLRFLVEFEDLRTDRRQALPPWAAPQRATWQR